MEKATLKDLIAKKRQKEENMQKYKEIEINSMGKALVFKKPSDETILNVMEDIGTNPNTRDVANAYKKLIYLTCEALQDTELQKELGIVDPFDTVDCIFDLSEVLTIGEELFEFSGITSVGEEIKNF